MKQNETLRNETNDSELRRNSIRASEPDFGRIVAALNHQEADRVPLAEAAVCYEIMGRFLGREVHSSDVEAQVEFWTKAGYDFIPLTAGMMDPGKVTMNSHISQAIRNRIQSEAKQDDSAMDHGLAMDCGNESWNLEKRAAIQEEEDFDLFPWEEAGNIDYTKFHKVKAYLPAKMKIVALSGKIFTLSWLLMGYENFSIKLMLETEFVKKVIDQVASIQFKAMETVVQMPNLAAVWIVDDIAFGTGMIVNPEYYRQLIFPWYKKFAKVCHDNGKYLFFHSDGLLWDVMDDLIEIGVDALHPIDPTCMDIAEVKRRVGNKICIFGNVPNDLLMTGTPEEVAAYTRNLIRTIGPGGGYCVGSGNSVPEWASIDNYRAMVETVKKEGNYPIKA